MKKIVSILLVTLILVFSCKKKTSVPTPHSNSVPTANAGHPQSVLLGATVTLDGSASSDPESSPLSYQWTFVSVPGGSNSVMSDAKVSHPTFLTDAEGDYVVSLVVSDGALLSSVTQIIISVTSSSNNAIPIANAGADKTTHIGNDVILDGSLSHDANGDALIYNWSIISQPAGSNTMIINPTVINPTLTPDVDGDYVIQLLVNDGLVNSLADQVTITVASMSNLQQLMLMGLDAVDANYLISNHPNDVQTVLADQDRIFNHMPSLDNMFGVPTDPAVPSFNDNLITTWGDYNKEKFKKIFGRLAFIVNSPKFIQSFNNHVGLLNPAYQGNPPAIPFPTSYAEFRTVANNAILADNFQYTFFISNRASGIAYGETGLKLKVEVNMITTPTPGAPHNAEALILHELTHTWGYTHDAPNAADYILKPNNIPYYVQAITGTSWIDPSTALIWDTPDALLTVYFGN